MRRATQADLPDLVAFLTRHAATSMFPLSNLDRHGLDGDDDRAMAFWIDDSAGMITAAIGITNEGMVMPQAPAQDLAGLSATLSGRRFIGMIGEAAQVRALTVALGCGDWAKSMDFPEALFDLSLGDIIIPAGDIQIIPVAEAPKHIILAWITDYLHNTLHLDLSDAQKQAPARWDNFTARKTHVVAVQGDAPVAMTGFNATHGNLVQVGGVYTPPDLRGRGYARRAVALHLEQARKNGASRAILFAHNPAAKAAYRAIGFNEIGAFQLVEFKDPQIIHGPAS